MSNINVDIGSSSSSLDIQLNPDPGVSAKITGLQVFNRFRGEIVSGTVADWAGKPGLVSKANTLYVYMDYRTMTEGGATVYIPGLKVGDGQTLLRDLQFIDATFTIAEASALTAAESARNARDEAVAAAASIEDFANLAKSYAVGDSGARSGENEDNAKYYSEQAKTFRDTTISQAASAASSASSAASSASSASSFADSASASSLSAQSYSESAGSSASAAEQSSLIASQSASAASGYASAAQTSAASASSSAGSASASASQAASSESLASGYAASASGSASDAARAANDAETSAQNAAISETNAAASETNAASSARDAFASATSAAGSAADALASAQNASASASNAATSETNAAGSATAAQISAGQAASSASSAQTFAGQASDSATNASTSAGQAATSASSAGTSASNAASSEANALASAANAAASESNALGAASDASDSATLSESWAVGGTGTRAGEDTNNAKYWSDQAQIAAGGGVSSFNGRSGAVVPQIGDYTAAMVGALPNTTAIPSATSDLTNDSGFITASDIPSIPSKTSDLTNDSGFITSSDIPVTSVNTKTGAVNLTASDVGAQPSIGTASGILKGNGSGGISAAVAGTDYQAPISNNVTGSGTSGSIAKFNGTNTVTDGPAIGSDTTKYLRNDGAWAVPPDTTYSSQAATSGGTALSLVTTGEKYTWNNKLSSHQTIKIDGVTGATSTRYATCATAAATAAKTASVTAGTFSLATGSVVFVKFTYSNTAANPTLNINSTGAKAIMRYGTTAASTSAASSWRAGAVVGFVYDGTNWVEMTAIDDNTTYSSQAAASGGTAVSLVTTGEKYTWNNKLSSHQTIKIDGVTGATSTRYGTCGTAAATAAKTASITTGTFTLETGATVYIKFTYSNTVASPTLNVNSTGAKSIMRYGTTAVSTSAATSWNAGAVIGFTYDGANWVMHDWLNTDNNTTTGTTYAAASVPNNTTFGTNGSIKNVYDATKHTSTTVSLAVASWNASLQLSVTVSGVTASNLVIVSPAPASVAEWGSCGVYCSAQAANSLTFKCTKKPSAALTANVVIMS